MAASPQHSWGRWRDRLKETQADQLYGPAVDVIPFKTSAFDTESDFWVYAADSVTQPRASKQLKHYQPFQTA